jgi:hypothetical protein
MIRCAWCGAKNYAIDMWCSRCHHHLDWQPKPVTRRPKGPLLVMLLPILAAGAVALALVLPAAGWLNTSREVASPALPITGFNEPTASPTLVTSATPSPEASTAPSDSASTQAAAPTVQPSAAPVIAVVPPRLAQQPHYVIKAAGDPTAAINQFYQAVTAHQFGAAASLWSAQMQAQFPPPTYIDHRFSATQQIGLNNARVLSNNGSTAVVSVDVIELIGGQTREWVGTWQLVGSSSGWLLNSPNLRSA